MIRDDGILREELLQEIATLKQRIFQLSLLFIIIVL
ncbi:MAG: hypothetical protein BWY64_03823 [bacterium ADurb.Bin363]|mgnify:CR=1 FL=1|nr:MAG: hypothetical protein BWY64_03823 [bacterium ADurb.Bin363]